MDVEEPTALDVVNSEKDEPPKGEHHLAIEDHLTSIMTLVELCVLLEN